MTSFSASGHPCISACHATTLEFTTSADVTPQGDCIIGVSARPGFRRLFGLRGRQVLILTVGGLEERVRFEANPGYSDAHEMVIRKSGFLSPRTLGTHADKSALDLCFRGRLRDPQCTILARVERDA